MNVTRGVSVTAVALCVLALSTRALGAAPDSILSSDIKEADGTSAQDTNTGAGVKTNHLQDGAVTARKLGVVCPDGYYLQYTMFAGWTCSIGTPGPVGPQGPVGPTGPQGPAGPAARYANVVVVAMIGGDFGNLNDALNSIADASVAKPYLVKVMPGQYALPAAFAMKPYVDVEGSGETVTHIVAGDAVRLSRDSEIRNISIDLQASASAMVVVASGTPMGVTKLTSVTITKSAPGQISALELNSEAEALLDRVTVAVSSTLAARGVITRGRVTMRNCIVTASGAGNPIGILVDNDYEHVSRLLLENSQVTATITGGGNGVNGVHVQTPLSETIIRNTTVAVNGSGAGDYAVSTWGPTIVEHSVLTSGSDSPNSWAMQVSATTATAAYTRVKGLVGNDAWYLGTLRCIGLFNENAGGVTCP